MIEYLLEFGFQYQNERAYLRIQKFNLVQTLTTALLYR